jgi:hypothetical protein
VHRRHNCTALEREKENLATLDTTGGDAKYIFMEEAGQAERDESCTNGPPETTGGYESVLVQELLSWTIPSPPEIGRCSGSDWISHWVEGPTPEESIRPGRGVPYQYHRQDYRGHFKGMFESERYGRPVLPPKATDQEHR